MCKDKKGSKMNNLIGERLSGIENVQAENFRDNQDVQAIYAAQLNELRTRVATCYEEIHSISEQQLNEKTGLLLGRLNEFGSRLKIVEDITTDLQSFIVDHGGM